MQLPGVRKATSPGKIIKVPAKGKQLLTIPAYEVILSILHRHGGAGRFLSEARRPAAAERSPWEATEERP